MNSDEFNSKDAVEFRKQLRLEKFQKSYEKQLGKKEEAAEGTIKLKKDTYAMAFRAQHYAVIKEHELKPHQISQAFYSALFVFLV